MRIRRIIVNIVMTLALALAGGAAASVPAYAAPHPAGGGGGGAGGGGGGAGGAGGGGGAAAAPTPCPSNDTSKGQVLQGLGQTGSDCSDSQLTKTIQTAVTILSILVGIASVIVIIISGFKYIVSAGEQNKVASAKSTLIYALVGLAVAALTQLLIHFVLYNTNKT